MLPNSASTSRRTTTANENEFQSSQTPTHFPPPRTPLNTIPDPSQCDDSDIETSKPSRFYDKFLNVNNSNVVTPRGLGRSSSAQSTPSRRVSLRGRVSKGIAVSPAECSMEVRHFELEEDPSYWKDHNVQVLIRIRPLNSMEQVPQGYGGGRCLRQESAKSLVWLGHPETRFTFDHVACETISQEKLFKVAGVPMVENCMSGYNSCMFAYGQTGSGKTYTMMGEIHELEDDLSENCGITPRIFQYLFRRIRVEEESRRDEKLTYSCKCSFLEIYNEQVTDLLEPSSTNLQLREDLKKGVYVENLTEYNVRTVNDVVNLLLKGAANRKIAATHMNRESSRSHSVFTCIIESRWEKDSMVHFRFARLNLVDLAGSERQKCSGAEGDRLKEAANINKSLSTLGLVIMSLVDLAHGKQRHIPYRDSRLTFLLQDSLGGNSKTMIIANISPSICSMNETLSTLKFAQRAKLIQNNATVNEDASGDVVALQREIHQLKGQLSLLLKQYEPSRSLPICIPNAEYSRSEYLSNDYDFSGERGKTGDEAQNGQEKKTNDMDSVLIGALRREKLAEQALHRLQAHFEQMNHLIALKEEDAQQTKMMLRFREEKIKRLESLVDGIISSENYLEKENKALLEEIQFLKARIDRNPELTRFALENMRLLEQLHLFQSYYEQGERETLIAEVSQLRNQLLNMLEGRSTGSMRIDSQDNNLLKELDDCRKINSELIREVDQLQIELRKYENDNRAATDSVGSSPIVSDTGHDKASYNQEDKAPLNKVDHDVNYALNSHSCDIQKELMDPRLVIEAMESEQLHLIKELQFLQEENYKYKEILGNKDMAKQRFCYEPENDSDHMDKNQEKSLSAENVGKTESIALQARLHKMATELEELRSRSQQYQEEQASQLSHQHQAELVCEQVELETARTIIHLQEEIAALQSELNGKLHYMAQQNVKLRNNIAEKEDEIRALNEEWERATFELTRFLVDGFRHLKDASGQIDSIVCSFPDDNESISKNVERAARACVEKEETILLLQRSLEDAQNMVADMELKLNSLKGATMVINNVEQQDNGERIRMDMQLNKLLKEKTSAFQMMEKRLESKEKQVTEAEKRAYAAFLVIRWIYDTDRVAQRNQAKEDAPISELIIPKELDSLRTSKAMVDVDAMGMHDIGTQVQLARLMLLDSLNAVEDTGRHVMSLQMDICKSFSACVESVQNLVNIIHSLRMTSNGKKDTNEPSPFQSHEVEVVESYKLSEFGNQSFLLHQIKKELADTNDKLMSIRNCIDNKITSYRCQLRDEEFVKADTHDADYSTSDSESSSEISSSENVDKLSDICCLKYPVVDLNLQGNSISQSDKKDSEMPTHDRATMFSLRKEMEGISETFNKACILLTKILDEVNSGHCFHLEDMRGKRIAYPEMKLDTVEAGYCYTGEAEPTGLEKDEGCCSTRETVADDKASNVSRFFSKFDEAHATIKEADVMLKALLKMNENSKRRNGFWKQAGEKLIVERANLMKEIEQLESSLCVKETETQALQDEIQSTSVDILATLSSLEGHFLQIQQDVEQEFKVICADALLMGREMLYLAHKTRLLFEDVYTEIKAKEFSSFVLCHCYMEGYVQKIGDLIMEPGVHLSQNLDFVSTLSCLETIFTRAKLETIASCPKGLEELNKIEMPKTLEEGKPGLLHDNLSSVNLALQKELERKEILLEGLVFDFKLLQESTSNTQDIKDETEKLILNLSQARQEVDMKTSQLEDLLSQNKILQNCLVDTEKDLALSNSELDQAKQAIISLKEQNTEFRVLLKNVYVKKSEVEEHLEEQKDVIKSLEDEILHLSHALEQKTLTSVQNIENDLLKVTSERDQLCEEVQSLSDKLEMALALADENEAIAVEARQESEESKACAERKEEEVKILERSVEELECTINILEKKVCEMEEEVERHRLIRDSSHVELQALRQRLSTVEKSEGTFNMQIANIEQADNLSWQQNGPLDDLHEARNHIRQLEEERVELKREIKQGKEYISELLLHAEAQASQYQQKYKALEAMFYKSEEAKSTSTAATLHKVERSSVRTRGSSSPFKCISSLVQQMNLEKEQELSVAKLRIDELEALVASRQKEVSMLNTRLAAAESMTHDVIRDLLGIKVDMTNYANLIDQHKVQKLVEGTHRHAEEVLAKEQEINHLRKQLDGLLEERKSCMLDTDRREADLLAAQVTMEQLRERDQLLSAQNGMLKMDKTNLKMRVAELDDMVKTLLGTTSKRQSNRQTSAKKENGSLKLDNDLARRLVHSERLLSRVNDEIARYSSPSGSYHHGNTGKPVWK